MKMLLLLAALGLASLPAATQAQVLATTPVAAPTLLAPVAPDTVAAIRRLFAARRQQRNLIALGAIGAAGLGTAVTPVPNDTFFTTGDYAKVYGIGAAAIIAVDFAFGNSHSHKNEQRALADFEAHRLPRHVQRQLKAKYFR
jgi:peptidoglycan/LPS O-acetylase OafA/YrhL